MSRKEATAPEVSTDRSWADVHVGDDHDASSLEPMPFHFGDEHEDAATSTSGLLENLMRGEKGEEPTSSGSDDRKRKNNTVEENAAVEGYPVVSRRKKKSRLLPKRPLR